MLSRRFFKFIVRLHFYYFLSFQILGFFKVVHGLFKRYDVVYAHIIWVIEWTATVILIIDVSWVTLCGLGAFDCGLLGGNLSCFDRSLPRGSFWNRKFVFGFRFDSFLYFLCCIQFILEFIAGNIGLLDNAFCFGLDFLDMIFSYKIFASLSFLMLLMLINLGM